MVDLFMNNSETNPLTTFFFNCQVSTKMIKRTSMATTTSLNIAFIGGGNMASALIAGLLAKGQPTSLLHVVETDAEKLADFQAQG